MPDPGFGGNATTVRGPVRIHSILDTYSGAGVRSLLIDAGGLAALGIFALRSRLYERSRFARLVAAGDVET
jgi:hypothetical protein